MTGASLPAAGVLVAVVTLAAAALAGPAQAGAPQTHQPQQWPSGGQNISDTHANPAEKQINGAKARTLSVKWTFTTAGDVSATAAIVDNVAYFPDWGGYLNAVSTGTGALIWRRQISSYDGISGSVSRTSPAVADGVVYIGDQNNAHLMAVNATTGALIWITQLDTHPDAIITQSPLVYNGVVYDGVSSSEEFAARSPSYHCCTFRGSMTAVNATTGSIMWKTYMVPDNGGIAGGYSGGAIWSSTPALDPSSDTLYVTTGNNYAVPASVTTCQAQGGTAAQCLDPNDHIDAIVALNAATGQITWAVGEAGFDTWTVGCVSTGRPNCPTTAGPDADFGSGAQLFTIKKASGHELAVGAGEKNGTYWAVDAATGSPLWGAPAGPDGASGGIQWGTATDGTRIYVAEADSNLVPYTPAGSTQSTTSGSWAALNPTTGAIIWQTVDPSGGVDVGAVSTANGVVYAGSSTGHMYALSAATGLVLWDFAGVGTSIAGPSIVNGVVYWGNGYARLSGGTASTTFYAFTASSAVDATCTGTLASGVYGNVTAGPGCVISGADHITGNVTVGSGANLTDNGATIGGSVLVSNAQWIDMGSAGSVGGDVVVSGVTGKPPTSSGATADDLCRTTVQGNVQVHNNGSGAPFDIGGGSDCTRGLTIGGALQVQKNAGQVQVDHNSVGKAVQVEKNSGGGTLTANVTAQTCQLQKDHPGIDGSSNTAGSKKKNTCNRTA